MKVEMTDLRYCDECGEQAANFAVDHTVKVDNLVIKVEEITRYVKPKSEAPLEVVVVDK